MGHKPHCFKILIMYISSKIDYAPENYYYVVDGIKTASKNMALLLAGGKAEKIHFYNMEHVWDQLDWTHEPKKSIHALCEERAKQLRYQYDWLCLWLTTGYDSQTILDSFIRAGVKLDEIAYMYRPEYYKDPETPYVKVEIENYKKFHNPNLKVFELEIGLNYHKHVYNDMGDDWMLAMPGQNLRFSKTTPVFLHNFHDTLRKHKDQTPGRRADIYGYEKPRVDLRDGMWYAQSLDIVYRDFMGANVEYFFMTPSMPEIHVKQHHMMINWLETIKGMCHDMVHYMQAFVVHTTSIEDLYGEKRVVVPYYKEWNLALGRSMAKSFEGAHSLNKLEFKHEITAKETRKIIKHLVNTNDKVLNYAHKTRVELSRSCNNLTNFSVPVFGKSWVLRPYVDRSDEPQKIIV